MSKLHQLTLINEAQRDHQWEESFFFQLASANVKVMSEDPQMGPDSWPYLLVETSEKNEDATEPAQKIIQWAAEKGIGLVINPSKEYPDYVFTFGMLWNFRQTGRFLSPQSATVNEFQNQDLMTTQFSAAKIFLGDPSDEYLPSPIRKILKEFFRDQTILQPRILMMGKDEKALDLCFSLESLGNPPEKEHQGILEAISWFLPPHYSLALVKEKEIPGFKPL